MTRIVYDLMTRIVSDTMTRIGFDLRQLLLGALLACAACAPTVAPHVQAPPPVCVPPEPTDNVWIGMIAEGLQLNPYTDAATRANPYPCARAAYQAEHMRTPLPRCYYVPTSMQRGVALPVIRY
jgi:hypothetical protein